MKESTSREKILKNIRNAMIDKSENPYPNLDMDSPVFPDCEDSADVVFAENFTANGGAFVYCENIGAFVENFKLLMVQNHWAPLIVLDDLIQSWFRQTGIVFLGKSDEVSLGKTSVTQCEAIIARTGSIMVSSRQKSGRSLNILPENHVVVAFTSQLFPDIKTALKEIRSSLGENMPSFISFISGPSRTLAIEQTTVIGAHGPKTLFLFLIDDSEDL